MSVLPAKAVIERLEKEGEIGVGDVLNAKHLSPSQMESLSKEKDCPPTACRRLG